MANHTIVDIRPTKAVELDLKKEILSCIKQSPPTLPQIILYNEKGLQLFEQLTFLDEYYVTNAEINVLDNHADAIAASLNLQDGGVVVELGSGNLRKTAKLLSALDRLGKKITYYALDLNREELIRSLGSIDEHSKFSNITLCGLFGTYDDAVSYIPKLRSNPASNISIWWLGSSIGNMEREEALASVKKYREQCLAGDGDTLVCGIDRRASKEKPAEKIHLAYHDTAGVTREFILNGLTHANQLLDSNAFDLSEWEYNGHYDVVNGRHESWYEALTDLTITIEDFSLHMQKGDHILCERSYKFSEEEVNSLWENAGLRSMGKWADSNNYYDVHVAKTVSRNLKLSQGA